MTVDDINKIIDVLSIDELDYEARGISNREHFMLILNLDKTESEDAVDELFERIAKAGRNLWGHLDDDVFALEMFMHGVVLGKKLGLYEAETLPAQ